MDKQTRLLQLELETLWAVDERGRLRARPEAPPSVPLLAVAASNHGLVWACASIVPDELAAAVDDVLATTVPGTVVLGWEPETAAALLALLLSTSPLGDIERGPSFLVTQPPPVPSQIECWTGGDADRERLADLMPEADHALRAPWAVAIIGGRVAAVCETARSAPGSVEAGVWTYDNHRRQGLGTAVTAVWATLVAGRTTFYSTSFDNLGSQGIARRLGLRPLGQWWQVNGAEPRRS